MGTCISKPTVNDTPSLGTREVTTQEPTSSQQEGVAIPGRETTQVIDGPSHGRRPTRDRVQSTPHTVQPLNDVEMPPSPQQRIGASPSSNIRNPNLDHRQTRAEHSSTAPRRSLTHSLPRRSLDSKMLEVIPEGFRFRLFVVGKRQSGKSSLIKAVFKVDVTAGFRDAHGNVGFNVEFRPEDNRYLVVHEFSGFESRAGDSQNLQNIWDFISHCTDPRCPPSERLHAIWICIPAADAISGRLGEGVEEMIRALKETVPVILVLTKLDEVVSDVQFDIARGDAVEYELARAIAVTECEDSIRRRFDEDPRDIPAEIVSAQPIYMDCIEKLVVTTDELIQGSRHPSTGFCTPGEKSRVNDISLAWTAAIRVCRHISLKTSIEVGQSKHWRNLLCSVIFDGHSLKSCVDIIHFDAVEISNVLDRTRYLSSDVFKAKISHLVRDLRGYDNVMSGPHTSGFADWVYGVYRSSQENVCCMMGYIIHLTVILDAIFSTASGDISQESVQLVIDQHVLSGKRDRIHHQIRGFVAIVIEPSDLGIEARRKDLVLQKTIDLIQEFCVPDPVTG